MMHRQTLACYALIASAFVLAGLLVGQLPSNIEPTAYADQVINDAGFTFLTARTKSDDESLFILDNVNARMLILSANVSRKRLERLQAIDLNALFRGLPRRGR